MPDNIYAQDQGHGFGALAGIGATELTRMWSNSQLLAPWQRKAIMAGEANRVGIFGKPAWWKPSLYNRGRAAVRAAQQAEVSNIWSAVTGTSGGPIKRLRMARGGVEKRMIQARAADPAVRQAVSAGNATPVGRALKGSDKAKYLRKLTRGSIGRTAAGLVNPLARFGSAYFAWGSLIPLAAEGLVGGFNELARLGMRLERGTPETSVGFRDAATRERAFTMRQSSLMAVHMSQTGIRAALGDEANFLHG